MNEEEVKKLIAEKLDEFQTDFYKRSYPGFNIESRTKTLKHGDTEFALTTDSGQGLHFYEQGNCKMNGKKSVEIVGGHTSTTKDVAISIRAIDGDIVIEAKSGNLTLKGQNIILETTDPKGGIVNKPSKVFKVQGPEVDIQTTKMFAGATMDMMFFSSEMSLFSQAGPPEMGDGTEPIIGPSIFATIMNLADRAKMFFARGF